MNSQTASPIRLLHLIRGYQCGHFTRFPLCVGPEDCVDGAQQSSDVSFLSFRLEV